LSNYNYYKGLAGMSEGKIYINEQILLAKPSEGFMSVEGFVKTFHASVNRWKNKREESSTNGIISNPSKLSNAGTIAPPVPAASTPAPTTNPTKEPDSEFEKFTDLGSVEWAREAILSLAERGVLSGLGDGRFGPDEPVTREQFVKMIVSGFGMEDKDAESTFSDVAAEEWYSMYIASAQKNGIINGMADGSFGIGRHITRQEMAAIIYRVMTGKGFDRVEIFGGKKFSDMDDIEPYALESVTVLENAGVISGVGDGRFAPQGTATRAQAAKIIYEALKLSYCSEL
jgi:hypothetical protein